MSPNVRGLSPAVAGSVLTPTNAGFGLSGLVVGALHIRRAGSFWFPSVASLTCFGAALGLPATGDGRSRSGWGTEPLSGPYGGTSGT
jgi:hypothetical protein